MPSFLNYVGPVLTPVPPLLSCSPAHLQHHPIFTFLNLSLSDRIHCALNQLSGLSQCDGLAALFSKYRGSYASCLSAK